MTFECENTGLIIITCFSQSCFINRFLCKTDDESRVRSLGDFPNAMTFGIIQSYTSSACVVQEVVLRGAKPRLLIFRVMDA